MTHSPREQRKRLERVTRVKERVRDVKRAALAEASRNREDAEDTARAAAAAFARAAARLTGDAEMSAGELMGRSLEVRTERERQDAAEVLAEDCRVEEHEKSAEAARVQGEMKALERRRDELLSAERRTRDRAEQSLLDEAAARIGAKR